MSGNARPKIPSDRVSELADALKDATRTTGHAIRLSPDRPAELTGSKLGGLPYWPSGLAYPQMAGGSPDERLALLAQIDLGDLAGDPRLPDHGLLQFFVATDDLNGLEFDQPMDAQRRFRVVWHQEVDPNVTATDVEARGIRAVAKGELFPLSGESSIDLSKCEYWMTPSDDRFDKVFRDVSARLFGQDFADSSRSWFEALEDDDAETLEELLDTGCGPASHVLGHPFFTQYDPRGAEDLERMDTLLLQLGSDNALVSWGDSGVGNFFIGHEELARGDFGRVLYNWDCF